MAVLNVSFLNPKMRKTGGGGVNIMSDQLTMLENELAKDGYLSSGDYDILISKGQEIKNSGGLTPDQASNFAVKISNYQKARELSVLNKGEDIPRMDRDEKNTVNETVMMSGNNPRQFLNNRIDSLVNYINDLDVIIDRRNMTGDDITEYLNQRTIREREYDDSINAMMAAENFDGDNPVNGYVAYLETNNNGEIVNVDYARHGSKSGYAETSGMINGFQVFGKVNFKEDKNNVFVLGNQRFSAVDMMIQDPNNPGSLVPNKLVADAKQMGASGYMMGKTGFVNIPGENLKMQSYLPNNSWGKGANGTFYKRDQDGVYKKYINSPEDELPIEGPVLNLPSSYEQAIMKNSVETIDGADIIEPDEGLPMTPLSSLPMTLGGEGAPRQNFPTNDIPAPSTARTQQPTERASEGFFQTARRTMQSGTEFLKGVFR